jgi:hypothetical protein
MQAEKMKERAIAGIRVVKNRKEKDRTGREDCKKGG